MRLATLTPILWKRTRSPSRGWAFAIALWSAAAMADDTALLTMADAALRSGAYQDVISMLAPTEADHAGDARYDYLLGSARLALGQLQDASLALERAVAANPNHGAARLELGKCYFLLGNDELAEQQFLAAEQLSPPPAARASLQHFRDEMHRRRQAGAVRASGFVELTGGYDTNINNSPSLTVVPIPALDDLLVTLDKKNIRTADAFRTGTLGGAIQVPLGNGVEWTTNADVQRRTNWTKGGFDLTSEEILSGVIHRRELSSMQVSVVAGRVNLDEKLNRRVEGIDFEWRGRYWENLEISSVTQYLRYRFPAPDLRPESFNIVAEALGFVRTYSGGRGRLNGSLLLSEEHDTDARPDGKKRSFGFDAGTNWMLDPDDEAFGHVVWLSSRYSDVNSVFLKKRRDQSFSTSVGVSHAIDPVLHLRPQLDYVHNLSNLPIYAYSDWTASLNLRYDY